MARRPSTKRVLPGGSTPPVDLCTAKRISPVPLPRARRLLSLCCKNQCPGRSRESCSDGRRTRCARAVSSMSVMRSTGSALGSVLRSTMPLSTTSRPSYGRRFICGLSTKRKSRPPTARMCVPRCPRERGASRRNPLTSVGPSAIGGSVGDALRQPASAIVTRQTAQTYFTSVFYRCFASSSGLFSRVEVIHGATDADEKRHLLEV